MHPKLLMLKTALDAQSDNTSQISRDLANTENEPFKRQRGIFRDLFYKIGEPEAETGPDDKLPSGSILSKGLRTAASTADFNQDASSINDNSTAIGFAGRGFYQVLQLDGTIAYSREGHFALDENGHLVTSEGLQLHPEIIKPARSSNLTVSLEGVVTVTLYGSSKATQIGQLTWVDFRNYSGLEPISPGLVLATESSRDPQIIKPKAMGNSIRV